MDPGAVVFVLVSIGIVGGYACIAIGKRVGDEMAAWVIANDDPDSPAPEFGIDDHRRRPALGRYRWYAAQYRQLKRAKSEPPTLANQFAAVQATQVIGALVVFAGIVAVTIIAD